MAGRPRTEAIRTVVNKSIESAIYGGKFDQVFEDGLRSWAASVGGRYIASEIGAAASPRVNDAGQLQPPSINFAEKIGLHFLTGGAMAELLHKKFLDGGVGAVIGELVGESFHGRDPALVDFMAKCAAAIFAAIADQDPEVAAMTASNAARFNALSIKQADAIAQVVRETCEKHKGENLSTLPIHIRMALREKLGDKLTVEQRNGIANEFAKWLEGPDSKVGNLLETVSDSNFWVELEALIPTVPTPAMDYISSVAEQVAPPPRSTTPPLIPDTVVQVGSGAVRNELNEWAAAREACRRGDYTATNTARAFGQATLESLDLAVRGVDFLTGGLASRVGEGIEAVIEGAATGTRRTVRMVTGNQLRAQEWGEAVGVSLSVLNPNKLGKAKLLANTAAQTKKISTAMEKARLLKTQSKITSQINPNIRSAPAKPVINHTPKVKERIPTPKVKPLRGVQNPVVKEARSIGMQRHKELKGELRQKEKKNPGWQPHEKLNYSDGRYGITDGATPSGRPIELKPNTKSGIKKGHKQLAKYMEAKDKRGLLILYDKETGKRTYVRPPLDWNKKK